MKRLDDLRREIDAVDSHILEALARRRQLAGQVIEAKDEQGAPLRDALREERLLGAADCLAGATRGLDAHFVTRVFHEIIDDSVRAQQLHLMPEYNQDRVEDGRLPGHRRRVQRTGRPEVLRGLRRRSPSSSAIPRSNRSWSAVEDGSADFGILPVENTTAGSINDVYDLLSCAQVSIVGEEVLRVEHCLLGVDEVPLTSLRRVLSHPQALAQCMKFLSKLPELRTAALHRHGHGRAAGEGAQRSDLGGHRERRGGPAIRPEGAAPQRRGPAAQLHALRRRRQESGVRVDPRIPCKTSVVMATSHEEGSLLHALSILHEYKINLTKLESRPIPGMPFQYLFYIDFEGNTASAQVQEALGRLRSATTSLKVLGSYPSQHRARTAPQVQALVSGAGRRRRPPRSDGHDPRPCRRCRTGWPAAGTSPTTRSSTCAA